MSYLAIITFDLKYPSMSPSGTNVYRKITDELENLDFYKSRHGRKAAPFELPSNTYLAEFEEADYDDSKELADQISQDLKAIMIRLSVKGKFFLSVGKSWAWRGGSI